MSCENLETSLPKHKSNDLLVKESHRGNGWIDIGRMERTLDQETEIKINSTFTISSQLHKLRAFFSSSIPICPMIVNVSVLPTFQGNCKN